MMGSNRIFLLFFALFVIFPVFVAAQGGATYLIEVNLEGMGRDALSALERESGEDVKLAGRTATTAFLHVSSAGLRSLSGHGIEFAVITEEDVNLEYYIVDRQLGLEDALEWSQAEVMLECPDHLLISVLPSNAFSIHQLPSKRRLIPADAPAATLGLSGSMLAEAPALAPAFTYSPAVQAMVDSVSESRLYMLMRELTGETSVTVGGENYTIDTRYSPTDLCKVAGRYLKERFEALGLQTELQYFNFRATLKSVYFTGGSQNGWAVGRSGIIIRTEDGGEVWEPQVSGLDIALNDVFMFDEYTGCIVGNYGEILWTVNGGETWNSGNSPTGADLNKVHFTDVNTAYCCGMNGVVLKSTDGGVNWSSLSSGTSRDLYGIVFVNSTDGWAVGESGKIIRTTNSGNSWTGVSSPTTDELLDVVFVGETQGWISTDAGKVLKTEDGSVWQQVFTPVTESLRSVCFAPNGLSGWACGTNGAIVKSYDGGDTWNDMSLTIEAMLWDIFFANTSDGWYCGTGYLYHSVNGGADWENQSPNVLDGDVNVIATLPGTTSPEEIYIICGHYDDTSNNPYYDAPGADDNGTGTLATLEAARALRAHEFESTIRFVCFSREEQGLVGSHAYASMIALRGDSVAGVINFDMIGYVDQVPEELEVLYDDNSYAFSLAFEEAAGLYVPSLSCRLRYNPSLRASDHASFWDRGYPAFCGIEDSPLNNPYYHRTTDRVGTLDFDFYGDAVRAAVGALAEFARIDSTSAGVPGAVAIGSMKILPNPCVGGAVIELAGRVAPDVALEFYNVEGRLVSSLRPEVDGGRATAVWNAEDGTGTPLSPGIYFVKVAGTGQSQKIVLLK